MKNRFLLLLFLLPFFSFGDWYVFPYYWTSSSGSSPSGVYSSGCRSAGSSPIFSFFSYGPANAPIWFGVSINKANNVMTYPTVFAPRSAYTNTTKSVAHFIQDSSDNIYYHPSYFPDVIQLYEFATSLFLSGYRGQGFQVFLDLPDSSIAKFNFNPPLLFADVVTGTNSLFKAKLFDFLGSLSFGVNQLVINSDSGLSSFRDFVSDFSSLNYYSLSPTSSVISSSSVLYDNPVFWFGSQSSYPFEDVVNSISQSLDLQDTSFPDASARRAFVSDALKSVLSDSLKAYLLDQSSGVRRNFSDYVSDPSAAQSVIAGYYSTPLTNALQKMTTDWKEGVTNELAQNTANITNQLAQWKKDLKGHNDSVTNDLAGIGSALDDVAASSRGVADLLSGSSPNKAHVIVDNEVNVHVMNWPTDLQIGINARDLEALVNAGSSSVKPILDALTNRVDAITNAVATLPDSLVSISNLLVALDINNTNSLAAISFPTNFSLVASFGSLLHEDYSNFVERSFSDILTNLEDQYPAVYDSLQNLGLSEDSYYGRWWNLSASALSLISVSVHSNMLMFSSLMSDVAAVDSFANESLGMSPLSFARGVFSSMPSETQIEDWISQCTNAASAVSVAGVDLVSSLDAVSNSYVSIFKPFKGSFDSPGASVTFFKAANGDYVSIPVGDQSRAWLILRLGISFALVAVNILLLPKYILMLFTLFVRAYRIAIKFFPDDL